ncbi:MAG TPA: phage holin family protein [Verrucomicrobiae bacterium]
MSDATKAFLQRWFVTTLGVLVAASIVDDIHADGAVPLLAASLLLGILNAFLRPILLIATLPLLIVTFGLFTLVINALLLYFVAFLVKDFYVADFWAAIKGAILISIVSIFANMFLGKKRPPMEKRRVAPAANRPQPPADTGSGPVIDV